MIPEKIHYRNGALRRWPRATPTAFCRGRRHRAVAGQPGVVAGGIGIALGVRGATPTVTLGVENALGIAHFFYLFIHYFEHNFYI